MKFTLERSDALTAINRVVGIVARNSNVPILNNVLIETDGGNIRIRATDLDMEAVTACPAAVETQGVVTVHAGKLREVISAAAPGSQISFELDGDDDPRMIVKSGRSRFKLPVLGADQFPAIPKDDKAETIKVSASALVDILEAALVSVSQEVVRYYLCGVFFTVHNGRLRAVATNGHHLTYRDGPNIKAKFDGVIIPTKAVGEIIKAAKEHDGEINLSVSKALVGLDVGGYSMRAKTVDGNFPDYQRVIPSPPENVAIMDSKAVSIALRRAQIAAEDKIRSVLLDLSDGVLTVRGRGQAEASDEVEIEYEGEPTTLSFNSGYIAAILDRTDGAIEFRFGGAVDHTTWRGVGDDDGLTVMLPIRQH